jgi:hypothetical protein
MSRGVLLAFLVAAASSAAQPAAVSAQVVTGRVLESETGRPLPDVVVYLRSTAGHGVANVVTDTAGDFRVQSPRFGRFVLVASLIGMETVTSPPFDVQLGSVEVVLRMGATAVPLDPLTVETRSSAELGFLLGYYERMDRNQRAGTGRFITRDEIERRNPSNISDLLYDLPRLTIHDERGRGRYVTMRGAQGDCIPAVFVDGTRMNRRGQAYVDENTRPSDLEGVEIYTGLAQLPGVYHDERNCGVILFWSRRTAGPPGDGPLNWPRIITGVSIIGLMVLLSR